jgi:hypothetical protein
MGAVVCSVRGGRGVGNSRWQVVASGVATLAVAFAASLADVGSEAQYTRVFAVCLLALALGAVATTPQMAERACTRQVLGGVFVILATAGIQSVIIAFGMHNSTVLLPSAAVLVWGLLITGFWKRWRVWQAPEAQGRSALIVTTVAALMVSTQAAALLTANIQAVADAGPPLWTLEAHFGWHFLDNIPLLKVTETLRLSDPLTTKSFSCGVVLLAYQMLVVLPILGAVAHVLQRRATSSGVNTG